MTIYIVDIEAVDTRYTKQWKDHLPTQLRNATNKEVVVISGGDVPQATTPGAFLNFGGTNVYKSKQLEQIGEMFCNGEVKDGDYFLYTDAWNPTVIQLKYMAELLGVNIRIGGLWHAGSYDPQDFLGRLIGDAPWVRHAEKSMYYTYDDNYFATNFHIEMFLRNLFADDPYLEDEVYESLHGANHRIQRVGWPMEYLQSSLESYKSIPKRDLILFPHRIAPEKQVDIFKDLSDSMDDVEFVIAQERQLTKDAYHSLLANSKIVFSANQQETLGISCYEGALVGASPLVPDRLSYTEMYDSEFKYPSEWTEDYDTYLEHKDELMAKIRQILGKNDGSHIDKLATELGANFFNGGALYEIIGNQ